MIKNTFMPLEIFKKIKKLLGNWNINVNDWLVTAKYSRLFAGYNVELRENHVNVVVSSNKIPWKYQYTNFAETIPNKLSKYYESYIKFSYITDYDLGITPVDSKLFKKLKDNRQKKQINGDFIYYVSILDNLHIAKIKLDHCNEKELGIQKGIRLLKAIKDLQHQAQIMDDKKVMKECETILGAYRFRFKKIPKDKKILTGLPLGQGRVKGKVAIFNKGKVRKIFDPMILVTDEFTPRQLVYFNEVLGIVSESGGLVSHAAVVSREYNLPVILQVENATSLLKDGQYISMNLQTGAVKPLDSNK